MSQPQRLRTPSRGQPLSRKNGLVYHNLSFAQLAAYLNQPLPLSNHKTCCKYDQVLLITIPPSKLIKPAKPHPQPPQPARPLLHPIRLLGDLTITANTLPNKSPESNLKIHLGQLSSIQIVTSNRGLANNIPQSLQDCNGPVNEMGHKRPKRCRGAT